MFTSEIRKIARPASCQTAFHGEYWYKCPFCGKAYEYYDTQFGRGFEKTADPKIFKHIECGNYIQHN